LGDGGLQLPRRGKNAKLHIKHCVRQLPYLKWKKKLLDPFSRKIYKTSEDEEHVINGSKFHSTSTYVCYTICHPDITDFFYKYYCSGKKGIIEEVIDELNLLSLAIWVADDGSFYSDKKWTNSIGGKICTNSFSYQEQEFLKDALSKFFCGRINIMPYRCNGRNEHVLKLTGSDCLRDFLSMIRNVLPECIHFKLDPQRLHAKLSK
jgi:hypothetical protein